MESRVQLLPAKDAREIARAVRNERCGGLSAETVDAAIEAVNAAVTAAAQDGKEECCVRVQGFKTAKELGQFLPGYAVGGIGTGFWIGWH